MAESSLRASRPARKGGLPNALLVVAAAERPPAELLGIADEVTVSFPWRSLLRGTLALDDAVGAANGIAALLAPGGMVRILLSIDARDRLALPAPEIVPRDELVDRWRRRGLTVTTWRPATPAEIAATGSSWGRRLRAAGGERNTWRLDLCRDGALAPPDHDDDGRATGALAVPG
jgi:16S rRNA (adenine(1408)-N(1))-methyltransferase